MPALLTRPYLTLPEFKAAPTYLDLDDLIVGGTAGQQDAELYNLLLRASSWCDDTCEQPLGGHTVTETVTRKADRAGRFSLHPEHNPVRQVTAFSYGPDLTSLTALTSLTGQWVEGERASQVIIPVSSSGTTSWSGAMQFGAPPPGSPTLVRYTYTAGFPTSPLSAAALAGDSTLTLADPTAVMPGDVLRLWDPGSEEAVTVAGTYTPGAATVPLTAPLAYAHAVGAGVSGLPPNVHEAVIYVTCALLLGRGKEGQPVFNDALVQPTTAQDKTRRRGMDRIDVLMADARQMLRRYKRVM